MRRALVVGCSQGVWDEVKIARAMCKFDAIYLVKMIGIHWPEPFDWWVTLHPEFMPKYVAERRALGHPEGWKVVAPLAEEVRQHAKFMVDKRISYRWPGMTSSGSSGLFGVKAALDDGNDRVVCAGMPMLGEEKHFKRKEVWTQRDAFTRGWECAMKYLSNVRSVSGWTRQILGAPTPEWLAA